MLKVLQVAMAQVGYLEKASNKNLDEKMANAGRGDFTKFARDLDAVEAFYNGPKQGFAWCDVFVDWCFVQAYGIDLAKKLLCQPDKSLGASCTQSSRYFKNAGRFYTSPQPGDQIFFQSRGRVVHTGLVYAADSQRVYTIEGNTSGASGVVANGGGVKQKSYNRSYSGIYGYGRPDYKLVDGEQKTDTKAPAASVSAKTEGKCMIEMNVLQKGSTGAEVKTLQALLIKKYGISCGGSGVDGSFGAFTDKAVRAYQANKGLAVDGSVGPQTWASLLK